jgi:hypothetical protein
MKNYNRQNSGGFLLHISAKNGLFTYFYILQNCKTEGMNTMSDAIQVTFDELAVSAEEIKIDKREEFGCCSRYRECSLAGQCVNEDISRQKNCIYNRHLKNGKIFYTQNATGFSKEKYKSICAIYNNLTGELLEEFNNYLGYFFDYKRFHRFCFCQRTDCQEQLAAKGLIVNSVGLYAAYMFLEGLKISIIKALDDRYNKFRDYIIQTNKENKKNKSGAPVLTVRKELLGAIVKKDIDYLPVLKKYAAISLPGDIEKYLYELFLEVKPSYNKIDTTSFFMTNFKRRSPIEEFE